MPTIELVSVGAEATPVLLQSSHFNVLTETTLKSHRELFQPFLDDHTGVIVHLAGLKCEDEGEWFAYDLVRWDKPEVLQFRQEVFEEVQLLLETMLDNSPDELLLFLSDYQFGPDTPSVHQSCSLARFIENHEQGKLEYNALYKITKEA